MLHNNDLIKENKFQRACDRNWKCENIHEYKVEAATEKNIKIEYI